MRMPKSMILVFLTALLMLPGIIAHAVELEGKHRDKDALRTHLWELLKQQDRVSQSVTSGKQLTQFCTYCHGTDGISKNDWEPNLAGQDATYLLDQLINFASGERKNLVMNDLTSKFTDGQLIDIAVYYSRMENTYIPTDINAELMLKGKGIYQKSCTSCHGVKGKGIKGFANLSGQKSQYLVNNLTKFQGDSRRASSVMGPIVANLTDADIQALAAYIPTLNIARDDQ